MNGYVCFYDGKRIEVEADTLYEAKQKAVQKLRVRPNKAHMVSVVLAEKDGNPVVHTPDF